MPVQTNIHHPSQTSTAAKLTAQQLAVVNHSLAHHAKVTAVAGAGKTTTLIERVIYLLEQGVAAHRIAVLMFNKSAQEEFSQRLQQALANKGLVSPPVMTFHGFGMRLCQRLQQRGLLPKFELKTDEFSLVRLLRDARQILLRDGGEMPVGEEREWLEDFLLYVDQVKAAVLPPEEVFEDAGWAKDKRFFIGLYQACEQRRQQLGWAYFADLLKAPQLLLAQGDAGEQDYIRTIAPEFDHLLIDEFQDINPCQYELLKALYGQCSYWMIVGDVQQCIYEWRGAAPEIMDQQFVADFAHPASYSLPHSFRFGHQIGMMATSLLHEQAPRQQVLGFGQTTEIGFAQSDRPGKALLMELKRWLDQGGKVSDCAVLARLYSDMVPVQLALMHRRVPYQLHGDSPLLENRQIRLLMAYLAVMAGGLQHPECFYQREDIDYLITVPNAIGDQHARQALIKKARVAPHLLPELLEQAAGELDGWKAKKLLERADWLRTLAIYDKSPGQGLVSTIEKLGIYRYFEHTANKDIQIQERIATCDAFIAYVQGVGETAGEVLEQLKNLQQQQDPEHGIHLMTIHKAKGLEFDCVMLAGLQEGRFPYYEKDLSAIDRQAQAQLAAERRLFYVAITRAKQRLAFLTAAGKREQSQLEQGQLPVTAADNKCLSRFVFESQPKVVEKILAVQSDTGAVTVKSSRVAPLANYLSASGLEIDVAFQANDPGKSGLLKPGDRVRHDQYGQGIVVRQEQSGKRMIFVDFESEGLKRFNPKHTKLVPLSRRGSA